MLAAAGATALAASAQVEWRNLDDRHRLSGRKLSEGYMLGKVVLVDRWGAKCPPCRKLLPQMEVIWQSFKTRSFVLLGGHCEGWGSAATVKDLVREYSLTYPVYEGGALAKDEPVFNGIPFLYVVDPRGKVVYRGRDERLATDHVVGLLARWETPDKLADWKNVLDFEFENLPGKALRRYDEFRKKFPLEAEKYATPARALAKLPGIEELKKLEAIVANLRDYQPKDRQQQAALVARIGQTLAKYAHLKQSGDPQIAREAKNALADLTWIRADL